MIRDLWISNRFVCFVFQGSSLCDRPVSGNNRLVKFASQIFLIFLILVTSKNNATSASSLRQKSLLTIAISFAILEQSKVILSKAGRTRYIVICINPAFTKMIDGTGEPKIPSKFAKGAARYNEFRCNLSASFSYRILCSLVVASSPPVFDQVPVNNVTAQFQRAFSIRCSSKPPVVYPSVWDWKKDGQPLSADDITNKRITSSAGRLLVKFAVAEDSGNYTCTLVNSAGSIESAGTEVIVKG